MESSIDITKLKGYRPEWEYKKPAPDLIPVRHVCGEIVYANLESEYPPFYDRNNPKGNSNPLSACPRCEYPLTMDWMQSLYRVEPMPYDVAIRTMGKVCSNCWGQLEMSKSFPVWDEDEGLFISCARVTCRTCGEETRGYVTHRYVGYARERDYLDYGRAIQGIAEALELEQDGLPFKLPTKEKLSERANLAQLGF